MRTNEKPCMLTHRVGAQQKVTPCRNPQQHAQQQGRADTPWRMRAACAPYLAGTSGASSSPGVKKGCSSRPKPAMGWVRVLCSLDAKIRWSTRSSWSPRKTCAEGTRGFRMPL